MKRSKHSLSHYKLLTCDMGELVPVSCFEVLPGDTVQQASSALVRASPLLTPVMHPVQVRIHHWFVPNRLIWDNWENFITGGPDGLDASVYPTITHGVGFGAGSLQDYLGLPPSVAGIVASALPIRAYQLIFNEFYRDQDLVTAAALSKADGDDSTTSWTLQKVAWEKDRFTSARPWPQKGPDVTLPLGTSAPVVSDGTNPILLSHFDATPDWANREMTIGADNLQLQVPGADVTAADQVQLADPSGLVADLSSATAVDVNQVRLAFALQRYQEARAQYGSRYTEYLRFLGVRSSDARLQRPEYLGGGKQTISFSEVLQTGTNFDANTGVATLRGHGIAAMRSRRYRRFFEEHGYVMSLMSVRPKTMYVSGVDKSWLRTTKEDYWQRELEQIGQVEIQNQEVFADDTGPEDVFGYTDRYSEYRHMQSSVAAEMRDTLNMWHLARTFASDVALNSDFVTCSPSKRIFAAQGADTLWIMVNNNIQARRMVRKGTGIGRII